MIVNLISYWLGFVVEIFVDVCYNCDWFIIMVDYKYYVIKGWYYIIF